MGGKRVLIAGRDNELSLAFHGHKPTSVIVSEWYYDDAHELLPLDSILYPKILWRNDGTAYVNLVPSRRGDLKLNVQVFFEDRKESEASADAIVKLPEEKPVTFAIHTPGRDDPGREGTIYMDLSPIGNQDVLRAGAVYKAGGSPVAIDVKDVDFEVIATPGQPPPVTVDGTTGFIRAVHYGHALIVARFEGLSSLTCVDVVGRLENGGDPTVCAELVPPGMSPPASRFETVTAPESPKQ
ncbi:MAG: hypothetical protein WA374_03105 [Acidobacteriaceae bacterium]